MSSTALAKTDDQWRGQLRSMDSEFQVALPTHIAAERFRRACETAVMKTPKLLDCDRKALFQALMQCAETGLMPDGKHAALVPYKKDVQFQPMVYGLLSLMRNSDEVKDVTVDVICENDEYDVERGMNPHIAHRPNLKTRGELIAAYVILKTKDGGVYSEIMNQEALHKVRNCSQAWRWAESGDRGKGGGKKDSPWHVWEDEMAIKSVIKRLAKRAPTSNDRLIKAVDFDNLDYRPELASAPVQPQLTQSQIASAKLTGQEAANNDDTAPESPAEDQSQAIDVEAEDQPQDAPTDDTPAVDVFSDDYDAPLLEGALVQSVEEAMEDARRHCENASHGEDLMERYATWKEAMDNSFQQPRDIVLTGRRIFNDRRLQMEAQG